jgi:CubicO group peptidase (beta-lactamase class C family)
LRAYSRYRKTPAEPVSATDWYTPTVDIGTGAQAPLPEARAGQRSVAATALDSALKYAQDKNSDALIVAHRGAIQLEYYKPGFGPDRLLDSQSMHKPLAAIVTMAAVADGRLSLDDPLAKFIPRWRDDARGRITVRDVLYMQTGLSEPQ